jgi:apolipoprotein D and lipocalin family protein
MKLDKITNSLFLIAIILFSISCKTQQSIIDKTVVKELDINKYLGTWYELARLDHSFERNLVGVKAEYSLREDGKIKVVNSGYKKTLDGKYSEAIGKAKIPDPNIPSKLKVSFFWIFYGDYFVMELDKDYQWALIGSKSDDFLWILSRKPKVADELYEELLNKLRKRGYDTEKLIKVPQ